MKNLLITLPILTTLLFNTAAMAENDAEKPTSQKSKSGPMSVFKRTSPMPLLMAIIVKHGEALGLSEKQNAVFTQWRIDNMGSSLKTGNEIIAEEKALSQAALDGKPNADVDKMLSSVLEKRHSLASNMLKCRDMIIETLDKTQWKKLITLYNKQHKDKMMAS